VTLKFISSVAFPPLDKWFCHKNQEIWSELMNYIVLPN
jgi:hypothetical protein